MEDDVGETVDDQGSGWFQVKKKHRSSSKFSVQSWVGGFSGKAASNSRPSQPSFTDKSGNVSGKRRVQLAKAGGSSIIQEKSSVANPIPVTSEDKKVVSCADKCVVEQDNECQKLDISISNDQNGDTQRDLQEEKSSVVQNIKWGDLEDDTLVPYDEKSVGLEIRFGDIDGESILACRELKELRDVAPPVPNCRSSGENDLKGEAVATHVPSQMVSAESSNEEDCKEVALVSSSSETVEMQNTEEKIVCPYDDDSSCTEQCGEHVKSVNDDDPSSVSPAGQEDEMLVELAVSSEVNNEQMLDEPNGQMPSPDILLQDTSGVNDKHQIPGEPTSAASAKDAVDDQHIVDTPALDLAQKAEKHTNAPGEDDSSESKERFRQRLWCFLFENLNRAVDELYLLCELECDLEQMKEAILVLGEAGSDFKELTSRVEKFENAKRSSSVLTDGLPITLKTDHRRPHALSWEVRRMTTSPHKAEILSSSIEAFRKIQEERASIRRTDDKCLGPGCLKCQHLPAHNSLSEGKSDAVVTNANKSSTRLRKQSRTPELVQGHLNGISLSQKSHSADVHLLVSRSKDSVASSVARKSMREHASEKERAPRKDKLLAENFAEKPPRYADQLKRHTLLSEKDKEKKNMYSWKSMDAWKEKRNWEDILSSPFRVSSRVSHSPGLSRKSAERARILHDKLMSPEKKKKTAVDMKKEAEEKHARAMRIRNELENERMQKLQRTSEKLSRVNEWQAVRSLKLREGMYARHQRSETRHEAFLAQVVRRAGDESSKVNEVRFITSLNEENKKLILRQKLQDSEMRRAEKLQVMKIKQREDLAREEAVLERRKLIESEKLQRLAETQRKKEEAQVRREEERRASSAAREARAIEQLRRKEVRAKAQQEEAELLAQKLAEKLSESEQRRKFYLEQIRERASMDFRDQSSPLVRRSVNKESQGRSTPTNISEDYQANGTSGVGNPGIAEGNEGLQHSLKRRIKRIRQRLMALKHEFVEPPLGSESTGIGYRAAVGSARAKIGRWLQELQRLRQARKEGAASIGLIAAEMIKFLEGKEPELQAARQAGLLDFIASALPASHISKPEACQVTMHLLKLLKVVLSLPANRSYFLCQNLLPPIIPMMSAALESYIKIAAALSVPVGPNSVSTKASIENFESISEVLDGFLWTVTVIIGHVSSDERQLQMREGLLELLTAYQVIHRLRDLFALYDRPQVEGSPFPSSIVFSIQLLVVLTSSRGTSNSIDWEMFTREKEVMLGTQAAKLEDSADFERSSLDNPLGDQKVSDQVGNTVVSIPEEPEDSPKDELSDVNANDTSVFPAGDREKAVTGESLVKVDNANTALTNAPEVADATGEATIRSPVNKKDCKCSDKNFVEKDMNSSTLKQPDMLLLAAISETGLVCLPSLLTSVLLQANNRLSDQAAYILPSNFEEVATGVLKFLNNLAFLDIAFLQKMLARPDLKMEIFHLMSFLLSQCNSKWKSPNDQVGLLLLESLLLLGHFALFHHQNQAVLRWGSSPTILHKVCDLPFVFFSDPQLMPVLASTLVAACYGCEQNRGVVQQELSVDMLLSLLKSCRNVSASARSNLDNLQNDSIEYSQMGFESRKSQAERSTRSTRGSVRNLRTSLVKGTSGGNGLRMGKKRGDRAVKCEEGASIDNAGIPGTSSLMLHCRFPDTFISRAEKFFSDEDISIREV